MSRGTGCAISITFALTLYCDKKFSRQDRQDRQEESEFSHVSSLAILARDYLAPAASVSRSITSPCRMTFSICVHARIVSSGFAVSSSRFASLPALDRAVVLVEAELTRVVDRACTKDRRQRHAGLRHQPHFAIRVVAGLIAVRRRGRRVAAEQAADGRARACSFTARMPCSFYLQPGRARSSCRRTPPEPRACILLEPLAGLGRVPREQRRRHDLGVHRILERVGAKQVGRGRADAQRRLDSRCLSRARCADERRSAPACLLRRRTRSSSTSRGRCTSTPVSSAMRCMSSAFACAISSEPVLAGLGAHALRACPCSSSASPSLRRNRPR